MADSLSLTCEYSSRYRIAGNFEGENFRGSVGKERFVEKTFAEYQNWLHNGCGMPRILWRKLSQMAKKSRNS